MEILPAAKIVKSGISLIYDRHDSYIHLKRENIGGRQSNCTPWSCFQRITGGRLVLLRDSFKEGSPISQQASEAMPISLELEPICSESQFDRVVAEAQQLESSVVVSWMASWCRKCIYLKPKLERLAAEYYPSIRFYSIDVNNVPHKLVVRAGVSKMPTIQLWRDGKKFGEVIGGHKAHLVVNDVREMIDNEDISIST